MTPHYVWHVVVNTDNVVLGVFGDSTRAEEYRKIHGPFARLAKFTAAEGNRPKVGEKLVFPNVERIMTRQQLVNLKERLQVGNDWHEPDNQEVTATVQGGPSFDNAGFWGYPQGPMPDLEMYVTIYKDDQPVANVNLATLFAWATETPITP